MGNAIQSGKLRGRTWYSLDHIEFGFWGHY